MNKSFLNIFVLYMISLPALCGYGFTDMNFDEYGQIEYVGIKESSNDKQDKGYYRKLKDALGIAMENNDVANLAAIYFLAKVERKGCVAGAVMSASVAGVGIGFAPVTLGISLIAGAPGTAFCVVSSVMAHRFVVLKRRAAASLKYATSLPMFEEIRSISNKGNFSDLKLYLQTRGVAIDWMIKP